MIRRRTLYDRIEPFDRHELIDSSDPKDAIEPTDRTEPTEPTDSTDPFDPIDSTESSDHSDHLEFGSGLVTWTDATNRCLRRWVQEESADAPSR